MKQGRIVGLVLGMVNIMLIAVCIIFYIRADRIKPVLAFEANDLVYIVGTTDQSKLLEGITAYDSCDGDITDRIVIEKLIEKKEENKLIVFYAVSDKSGNVAKASREFETHFLQADKEEIVNELKEAGAEAEFEVEMAQSNTKQPEEHTEAREADEEISQTPSPNPTMTPSPESAEESEEITEQEPTRSAQPPVPEGAPVLTLKASEIKTKVGSKIALVDVIGNLSDDKDNYETLFHNIQLGEYDVDTPGRYAVTMITEDSDGNQSQEKQLTIIVE